MPDAAGRRGHSSFKRPRGRHGVVSVSISLALGVPIGLAAGFAGGWVDGVISRVTDAFLACPFLILAIALAAFLGPSLTNAMIAIGVSAAPIFVRLTRALGPVRFARQFADVGDGAGIAQEGGNFIGQRAHRRHADQPVPGRAPGQNLGGRSDQRRTQKDLINRLVFLKITLEP